MPILRGRFIDFFSAVTKQISRGRKWLAEIAQVVCLNLASMCRLCVCVVTSQLKRIEQVRKRGLPPPFEFDERGQAPLPDLFYSSEAPQT